MAAGPDELDVDGPVAVPLIPIGHLVAVEAKINGKGPYRFIVDSGAGGNMRLSEEIANELALPRIGEARSGDPSGRNMTTVPLVRVETVQIAGARFSGVTASAGGRENVIGLGLFGALTVIIDYPKQELRLTLDRLAANGKNVLTFTRPRGIPEIDVNAGGVTFRADVDTGSPAFMAAPSSFGVPLAGEPRVVGRGRTANNEFEIRAAELRGDLVVAGWTHAAPMVDIVDHFPVAHIGSRLLRQYVVTFDLENQRLRLAR
jgi:predicted aspartyl protease